MSASVRSFREVAFHELLPAFRRLYGEGNAFSVTSRRSFASF